MTRTATTDLDLLHRFVNLGDAEAFNVLARRHAGLVFQTCLRVLRNRTEAEDAAQETFHQLMRTPEAVSRNVPAWLHAVATRKCLDHIRSESARRKRERAYQIRHEEDVRAREAGSWSEVEKQVDVALSALRAGARDLLVDHFLVGTPQSAMAVAAGVSRATMCRRVNQALAELRVQMGAGEGPGTAGAGRKAFCGGAALFALPAGMASATPPGLLASVGKMAMLSGTLLGTGVGAKTLAVATAGLACMVLGVGMSVFVVRTAVAGFPVEPAVVSGANVSAASPLPTEPPDMRDLGDIEAMAKVRRHPTRDGEAK